MTEYIYNIHILLADGTSIPALQGVKLHSPGYGQLKEADVLAAIRANPQAYAYEVDRQAGMVYLGSAAVPLEQFRGIKAELVSMSIISGE